MEIGDLVRLRNGELAKITALKGDTASISLIPKGQTKVPIATLVKPTRRLLNLVRGLRR